ncbi:MAG: YdcF family protein [Bifidobacteriaceae bacterium]|jgi:uncharacterized SAM-binding protein YcdF (DUF218 family)|nr:YdcF family protein [Bifidobacteriaceae bacterium]
MPSSSDSPATSARWSRVVAALVRLASFGLGGAAIGNATYLAIKTNMNSGVILEAGVGLVMVSFGASRRLGRIRWLRTTALAAGGAILAASVGLAAYGLHDTAGDRDDALIVLGAGVHGRSVTAVLAARLDVAVEYHRRNPAALIVVAGGQGPQEDISEAEAMSAYLVRRGVPADRIVKEDKSTSTAENFAFAKALLDERLPTGYRIAFVTSEFHVFRAEQVARSTGLKADHLHSHTLWYVQPASYLREIVAVAKQLVFG